MTWLKNCYMMGIRQVHKNTYLRDIAHPNEFVRASIFYVMGNCFLKSRAIIIRLGWMQCILRALQKKKLDFGEAIYTHLIRGMDRAVRGCGHIEGFSIILLICFIFFIFKIMMLVVMQCIR